MKKAYIILLAIIVVSITLIALFGLGLMPKFYVGGDPCSPAGSHYCEYIVNTGKYLQWTCASDLKWRDPIVCEYGCCGDVCCGSQICVPNSIIGQCKVCKSDGSGYIYDDSRCPDVCRDTVVLKYSGVCLSDGQCNYMEKTCPYQCKDGACITPQEPDIRVTSISAPASAEAGSIVPVGAIFHNYGYYGAIDAEVCIFPNKWKGIAFSVIGKRLSVYDVASCCPQNEFCQAKTIYLDSNTDQATVFTPRMPSMVSVDHCNNLGSAWDDSFTVVAGTYKTCGGGYTSQRTYPISLSTTTTTIPPYCTSDADCPSGFICVNRECVQAPMDWMTILLIVGGIGAAVVIVAVILWKKL